MSPRLTLLRALRHRNYRIFMGGQLISLIGTWMQTVAESWLVYRLTGSAVLLGLAGFANRIPIFLLSPIGGAVADRYNRHRIVIATQAASMVLAAALAFLTLTHLVRIWHLMAIAALLGVVNAFDIPARQAFVVELVAREDLQNAIALNSSMFNGARVVGPAIAGVLVAAVGEGWCFLANAVSYIAVIVGLLIMRVPRAPAAVRPASAVAHVMEGFRFVSRSRPIVALLLLLGLISLMGMPYSVLMPIIADQTFHSGARGLGILMGASGVGALLGALSLASRVGLRGYGRTIAFAAIGFGLSLMAFSMVRSLWLGVALLLPVGFAMMTQMAASNTLIQSMIPNELRGRVMAVYSMMFMGMAPIGALLAGSLAGWLGATTTVAAGGAFCLLGGLLFLQRFPRLRGEARQLILAQQVVPAPEPPA
ncbi:MAG TPA: MFS transporter [Gemmatimonadales bacterium]|nr:MFS transporter [Gemmatimonadales bacterium]